MVLLPRKHLRIYSLSSIQESNYPKKISKDLQKISNFSLSFLLKCILSRPFHVFGRTSSTVTFEIFDAAHSCSVINTDVSVPSLSPLLPPAKKRDTSGVLDSDRQVETKTVCVG